MSINKFKNKADQLSPSPKGNSWERIEILLDNHDLQAENKSYRINFRFLLGIAASLLLLLSVFFFNKNEDLAESVPYQLSFLMDDLSSEGSIYELDKVRLLNGRYFRN